MWWPFGKRTVEDGLGKELRIAKRLKRWVALSPELYNTCLSLNPARKAVGVALTQKTAVPDDLAVVGTVRQLDIGVIKKLRPQVVLADAVLNDPEQIQTLVGEGLNVASFLVRRIDDAAKALPLIQNIIQGSGGEDLFMTMEALGQRYKSGPRAVGLVGKGPFRVAGVETLHGDLLRTAGCQVVPGDAGAKYVKLDLDEFINLKPEAIFMFQKAYPFRDKDRLDLSMHQELPAAQTGQIHLLPANLPRDYGPGILSAVQEIRTLLKSKSPR